MRPQSFFEENREKMIEKQIIQRGIVNPRLLDALRSLPRHLFVPPHLDHLSYEDFPLPIGNGQTISQPYITALMTSLLGLEGEENVLEIGTGSGYQAALLATLAKTVHTIERLPNLAEHAAYVLADLGISNVSVHCGDGSLGWPESAPYQGILVTAAAPNAPEPLLQQLAVGGRMVIPIGGPETQELRVWERLPAGYLDESILLVSFVPLRGAHGWSETEWP